MSVEYIDLSATSRLAIMPDPVQLDPRQDECVTGCYTPPNWWGHPNHDGPLPKFDHPGNIVEADDHLWESNALDPAMNVTRWSWMFYGVLVERHENTYWYCDRQAFDNMIGGEFTREVQHDIITADRLAYERYVRNEAVIVTLQRKATFKRVTRRYHEKHEDLLEVWEDIASVGDVYLDERDGPAQLALDYFPLHRKERAAVCAMIDERTLS